MASEATKGRGFTGGSQSIRGDGRNEDTGVLCSSIGGAPVLLWPEVRGSSPLEATGRRPSRTRAAFQAVPASVRHAQVCAWVEKECHLRDRGLRHGTLA